MRLIELVFREINVVLVHTGIAVPAVSLDRVRAVRPSANMQVGLGPNLLNLAYPEERMGAQIDGQRVTATESGGGLPEASPIVDLALALHSAVGSPSGTAFGYNYRFDFQVENVPNPGSLLMDGAVRDPSAIAACLHTDAMHVGLKLMYRRGSKMWMFLMEPVVAATDRLMVHANVHEDLRQPAPQQPGEQAPAWLQGGALGSVDAGFPSAETMRADFARHALLTLETATSLLSLGAR